MPDFGSFRGFGDKLVQGQTPTQLGLIGSLAFAFDSDAVLFFDRITAAGGTLTQTEKEATSQLVIDMKASGIWSTMFAVYPMVGSSSAACAQNLKNTSYVGTFGGSWTFASTGVTGNGTNTYMDTKFNTSNFNFNGQISAYTRTIQTVLTAKTLIGDINNSDGTTSLISESSSMTAAIRSTFGSRNNTLLGNRRGLWMATRTGTTLKTFYNGVQSGTSTTTTSNNGFGLIYLGASGTGIFNSNLEFSLATIGDGLTDTQASDFYTAVQAFQTTLGRQV
jgi:hypothetical protein